MKSGNASQMPIRIFDPLNSVFSMFLDLFKSDSGDITKVCRLFIILSLLHFVFTSHQIT